MEKRISNTDLAIEDKDEENFTPSLYLKSNEPQPDEILEINEKKVLANKLHDVIKNLDERGKDIIQSRWLSNNKLTLEDLSFSSQQYSLAILVSYLVQCLMMEFQ